MLVGALITFLVVILILYLINLLPLDGRAKQIARVVVIVIGIISLLKYLAVFSRQSFAKKKKAPVLPGLFCVVALERTLRMTSAYPAALAARRRAVSTYSV